MKRHPELGYRMLANIPFLEQARRLVLTHHERFDERATRSDWRATSCRSPRASCTCARRTSR